MFCCCLEINYLNKMARSGGETMEKSSAPIFKDISGDDPDLETTTIESLCMDCGKNVSNNQTIAKSLLLTKYIYIFLRV